MKYPVYRVTVEFVFDENETLEDLAKNNETWGYGRFDPKTLSAEQIYDELHECLSREFAEDECGIASLPSNFVLKLERIDCPRQRNNE